MYGRSSRDPPPIRAERFIRYCAVGGVNTITDLTAFVLLITVLKTAPAHANVISYANFTLRICTQQTFYISIFGLFAGDNSTILSFRRPKFSHSRWVDNCGLVAVVRDHPDSG